MIPTAQTIAQYMLLATFLVSLVAFAVSASTLRRPLARAFAWLCFGVYFGVTCITLDLMFWS